MSIINNQADLPSNEFHVSREASAQGIHGQKLPVYNITKSNAPGHTRSYPVGLYRQNQRAGTLRAFRHGEPVFDPHTHVAIPLGERAIGVLHFVTLDIGGLQGKRNKGCRTSPRD